MKKEKAKRWYGYLPDHGDYRDFRFMGVAEPGQLPASVDLRSLLLAVYDQGRTNSCVSQATAAAHWWAHKKNGLAAENPSRLFIYYEARRLEMRQFYDGGCMIRDAIRVLVGEGVCPESEWPFSVKNVNVRPGRDCYRAAGKEQVIAYYRLGNDVQAMRQCLADGFPFVVGMSVYDSMETDAVARSGVVPLPTSEDSLVGGHAVLVVGYNDNMKRFIVRNSWSNRWGQAGYFTLDYAYLGNANLATDLWCIKGVE